jgi:cytochrome P450
LSPNVASKCRFRPVVFMIGPEANHYMTVSHARTFSWRQGHMGDLIPLLGDGLLTIDGEFGSRICIGMRFGQLEVKAIATALVRRFDFELEPGYELRIRQMPTIGPCHGVPMIVHRRDRAPVLQPPLAA